MLQLFSCAYRCEEDVPVVVDHEYDVVRHVQSGGSGTMHRRSLEQQALHSMSVDQLPRSRQQGWLPLLADHCGNVSRCNFTCSSACFEEIVENEERVDHNTSLGRFVMANAKRMAEDVAQETADVLAADWMGPCGENPLYILLGCHDPRTVADRIRNLSNGARRLLELEPIMVTTSSPAKIFGDIHGQLRDMLLFLGDFGFPGEQEPTFIFNGDWGDRGAHQLEVVSLIFALKLAYPDRVKLVRGNHEDALVSNSMGKRGLQHDCILKLGEMAGADIFNNITVTFNWLPLCCLIDDSVLCLHGGLGSGDWSLDYLSSHAAARPLDHDALARDRVLYNILWSDPIPETVENSFGVHASPRDNHKSLVMSFGSDITSRFCELNDLKMVVRSHQAKVGGCGYEVMHDGKCVRVFSARDYEGYSNDGSILYVFRKDCNDGTSVFVRPQVVRSLKKKRMAAQAHDSGSE